MHSETDVDIHAWKLFEQYKKRHQITPHYPYDTGYELYERKTYNDLVYACKKTIEILSDENRRATEQELKIFNEILSKATKGD